MYIQTHGCKNAQLLHFLRKHFIHIIADKRVHASTASKRETHS